jgi:hypothetical protein
MSQKQPISEKQSISQKQPIPEKSLYLKTPYTPIIDSPPLIDIYMCGYDESLWTPRGVLLLRVFSL